MSEQNKDFRLQFLHGENIFDTREEAQTYIERNFGTNALLAEPAVVLYGDKKNPSVILAIGTAVNGEAFIIDFDGVKDNIGDINEKINQIVDEKSTDKSKLEKAVNVIKQLINQVGLVTNHYDKDGNPLFKYQPDANSIVKDAQTVTEAINQLSEYVQGIETIKLIDSNSIHLAYKDDKNSELKAAVKISTVGNDDNVDFNNNIIGIKSDGLYAAASLDYDEGKNTLVYTTSGIKDGKYQNDAIIKRIPLNVVKGSSDQSNPIEINVVGENNQTIEGRLKLSTNEYNILKVQDGNLTARVTLWYDKSTNELVFNNGIENKRIPLNVGGLIEKAIYENGTIIIGFKQTNGNISEVKVPVDEILEDLVKDWEISNNPDSAIELSKKLNDKGINVLSAEVKINNTHEDNILVNDHGSLYVPAKVTYINDRKYEISFGEGHEYYIEIPEDKDTFITSVDFRNNKLILTRNDGKEFDVSLEELHTPYEPGDGLKIEGNVFSVQLSENEPYLELSDKCLKTKGIDDAINAEISNLKDEVSFDYDTLKKIEDKIKANTGKIQTNAEEININTGKIGVLENKVGENSVVEQIKDALDALDLTAVGDEGKVITTVSQTDGKVSASAATLNGALVANDSDITGTTVKDALNKLHSDLNSAKNTAITVKQGNGITVSGDGTEKTITAKTVANDKYIEVTTNGIASKATEIEKMASDAADNAKTELRGGYTGSMKDLKDAIDTNTSVVNNIKGEVSDEYNTLKKIEDKVKAEKKRAEGVEKVINGRLNGIDIKKDESGLVYNITIPTGEVEYPTKNFTINIPQDQFLKDVFYDNGNKKLVFKFITTDGEITSKVDVVDLVDTYEPGDGLKIEGNVFSIDLNTTDPETATYLTVTDKGLQLQGINKAIENAVGDLKGDASTGYDTLKGLENKIIDKADKSELEDYAKKTDVATAKSEAISETKTWVGQQDYATEEWVNNNEFATKTDLVAINTEINNKANSLDVYNKNDANEKFETQLHAANTYAKQSEVYTKDAANSEFLTQESAKELIKTQEVENLYLKKEDASQTYASKNDLNNLKGNVYTQDIINDRFLSKSDAANTYATKFNVSNTDTISLVRSDIDNTITADIKISTENSGIKSNGNGIFVNYRLNYNNGTNTIQLLNNNDVVDEYPLSGVTVVKDGKYDDVEKNIVLTLTDGSIIKIPVTNLIKQLSPVNPDNDPINIVIDNNANTIQANVNISTDPSNQILIGNGTLYASKDAEHHQIYLHGVYSNLAEVINNLDTNVTDIQSKIDGINSDLNSASNDLSDLKQKVTTNTDDIVSINGRLDSLESDINTNKASVVSLGNRLTTVEQTITQLQTLINGDDTNSLVKRIESLEQALSTYNNHTDFGEY